MWILVLKGLKQAIEPYTATAYLGLSTVNCEELFQPKFPHPSLDGILVHHSIASNASPSSQFKKNHKIKDL